MSYVTSTVNQGCLGTPRQRFKGLLVQRTHHITQQVKCFRVSFYFIFLVFTTLFSSLFFNYLFTSSLFFSVFFVLFYFYFVDKTKVAQHEVSYTVQRNEEVPITMTGSPQGFVIRGDRARSKGTFVDASSVVGSGGDSMLKGLSASVGSTGS